jgi:hypothetical protein
MCNLGSEKCGVYPSMFRDPLGAVLCSNSSTFVNSIKRAVSFSDIGFSCSCSSRCLLIGVCDLVGPRPKSLRSSLSYAILRDKSLIRSSGAYGDVLNQGARKDGPFPCLRDQRFAKLAVVFVGRVSRLTW